jgi:predicted N-acetyltransferase YhbS
MSLLVSDTRQVRSSTRERVTTIRRERRCDIVARERLLDAAFGAERFAKSSERLREGRVPASGLALVALEGERLVGTVRLWTVTAGADRPCLLLGPLAVAADKRGCGVGGALMHQALRKAASLGHHAVLLVGDAAYYDRFGFSSDKTGALRMPGPYERDRLLARELVPGALDGARGMIAAHRPLRSRVSEMVDRMAHGGGAIAQPA